jgi:hypothetical protein
MNEKSDSFQIEAVGGERKLAAFRGKVLYLCIYINFCPSYRHMLPLVFEARSG